MPVYFLDLEFGCRGKTHVRPIRQIAVYAEDGREVYAHEEPEPSTAGNARIAATMSQRRSQHTIREPQRLPQ